MSSLSEFWLALAIIQNLEKTEIETQASRKKSWKPESSRRLIGV